MDNWNIQEFKSFLDKEQKIILPSVNSIYGKSIVGLVFAILEKHLDEIAEDEGNKVAKYFEKNLDK